MAPRKFRTVASCPVLPKYFFPQPPALTGTAFCDQCGLTGGDGKLFVGSWGMGAIMRVRLDPDHKSVKTVTVAYDHSDGIMSLEVAPDGAIYFSDPDGIYRLENA